MLTYFFFFSSSTRNVDFALTRLTLIFTLIYISIQTTSQKSINGCLQPQRQSFNHGCLRPHDQTFPISTVFRLLFSIYDHQFLLCTNPNYIYKCFRWWRPSNPTHRQQAESRVGRSSHLFQTNAPVGQGLRKPHRFRYPFFLCHWFAESTWTCRWVDLLPRT